MTIKYVNLGNERGVSHIACNGRVRRVSDHVEHLEKIISQATEIVEQGLIGDLGKGAALERAKKILTENNN